MNISQSCKYDKKDHFGENILQKTIEMLKI